MELEPVVGLRADVVVCGGGISSLGIDVVVVGAVAVFSDACRLTMRGTRLGSLALSTEDMSLERTDSTSEANSVVIPSGAGFCGWAWFNDGCESFFVVDQCFKNHSRENFALQQTLI